MKSFLITNGTIIDGTGSQPLENMDILIENNIIKSIGPKNSLIISENVDIINAEGTFILPGFVDAHVHLMEMGFRMENNMYNPLSLFFYQALEYMKTTIESGVTTVRDAGLADIGVKMAAERNLFPAPRMQISVMPLSISGGHFDYTLNSGFDMRLDYPGLPKSTCDGIAEVRKRTRQVLSAGAEAIKVMVTGGVMSANDRPEFTQFTVDELKVIVEEAEFRGGVKVFAHAHGVEGIKNAVKAGIASIEHGTFIDKEACDMMVKKGVYLVPTFVVINRNKEKALEGDLPHYSIDGAIEIAEVHRENMKMAYESGVKMIMGTDSGVVEHGNNLKELSYLCDIGMEPMESIQAGTLHAAESLGWQDKVGTLEKGKFADLVMVKKDPLVNISSLSDCDNILMVMKDGKIFKNRLD